MAITCRRMASGDEALVTKIAQDVFDGPIDRGQLETYLASPGHLMVLAFEADLVVGQCMAIVHHNPCKANELYIDELGTSSHHLRQGIATKMLHEIFAWAREMNCTEAWLATELENLAANRLYEKLGALKDTVRSYQFDLR